MRLEFQIAAAFALDLLLGDPRRLPHPVTFIARFAHALESPFRHAFQNARVAGALVAGIVVCTSALVTWLSVLGAQRIHPVLGDIVSIGILYTCFAARSLSDHAMRVYRALTAGDLPEARRCTGMLVGRDTERMEERDAVRATVESTAENTADGVTAPLLFSIAFGPVGAVAYKAVNTLDSSFGYQNERYARFGWASARLDDLVNFIPARITAYIMMIAALLIGLSARGALSMYRRDRARHPSPNSGHPESAAAGALGVQLGGINCYFGKEEARPLLGDARVSLSATHILLSVRLMWATAGITLLSGLGTRWFLSAVVFS